MHPAYVYAADKKICDGCFTVVAAACKLVSSSAARTFVSPLSSLPDHIGFVNFQMLLSAATTNYGNLWTQIASP